MEREKIQDIYRPTPAQRGMLVYSLMAPQTGAYFDQFSFAKRLDPALWRRAFEHLVARHDSLRTSFLWEDLDEPVEIVHKEVELPVGVCDLGRLGSAAQRREIERFLARDRRRGLDLTRAPLTRMTLLRLAEDRYQVVWSYHHVVLDGWSVGLVQRELAAAYAAYAAGAEPRLPPAPRFRAYVRWLAGRDPAATEERWRRLLAGYDSPVVLGFDRGPSRAPGGLDRFESRERVLGEAASERLRQVAKRLRTTPFTLVQAAWALALGRHADRRDVVFGVTLAGRPPEVKGIASMVGCFVNTLPVRVRWSLAEPLSRWLESIRAATFDLQALQHSNLADVQRWSELPGDRPLFESALVSESFTEKGTGLESFQRTNYPLVLYVLERGAALRFLLNFDLERYHDADVERLHEELLALVRSLTEAAGDPGRTSTVGDVFDVDTFAVRRQSGTWNDTRTPGPPYAELAAAERTLPGLFERRADRDPSAVAVVDGPHGEERILTYGELERDANRLAHLLRGLGVSRGDAVAVHRRRGAEAVTAVMAVLKAGGAYVPVDPAWPAARLGRLLAATSCRVAITQRELLGAYAAPPASLAHLVLPDAGAAELARARARGELPAGLAAAHRGDVDARPAERPAPVAGAGDVAYTIFTSGSTGVPKGVVMRHDPVINLIHWVNTTFGVGPADRVLLVASLSFDLSVYDVFGSLAAGASVRVASAADVRSPERLFEILTRGGVTFWNSAPAALEQVAPFFAPAAAAESPLRLVFLSGDWVPLSLPGRVRDAFPRARVVALGGATEAAVWSNFLPVTDVEPGWRSIPYGRPIANARYYVLDGGLRPSPVGVPGDLFIGGDCLLAAYQGDAALSAAKILPDAYGRPGDRVYRTGDRARFWADGTIEFLGRLDHQVKVRGYRIELGEIEVRLRRLDGVAEAVAVVREDEAGERRIVAYLVPGAPGRTGNVAELRDALAVDLPEYMLPSAFVWLDRLPATANGKLDRRALPAPEVGRDALESEFVAPRSPLETSLAEAWAAVLDAAAVGVFDNFFHLGGDSIRAMQVVNRIRARGLEVTPEQLYHHPTVAELATVVRPAAAPAEGVAAPVRREAAEGVEDVFPLTPMQEGMAFQTRLAGRSMYTCQLSFRLPPESEPRPSLLRRAWQEVMDRQPTLRTSFAWRDVPRMVQRVHGRLELPWEELDWSAESVGEQEERLARFLADDRRRGFDLETPPLSRFTLIDRGPEGLHCVWTFHHVLLDGWSMRACLGEVLGRYTALAGGRAVAAPPAPSLRGFVEWLAARDPAATESFWRRELAGVRRPTPLGIDLPAAAEAGELAHASHRYPLPAELAESVRGLGLTLNTLFQGAWSVLLSRYSGHRDVVFGSIVAGRPAELDGVEEVLGLFINTLPVRVLVEPGAEVRPWLEELQRRQFTQREHQHSPVTAIQGWSEIPPGVPMYESLLMVENFPDLVGAGGIAVVDVHYEITNDFPLQIAVTPGPDLSLRLTYDPARLARVTVDRLASQLGVLAAEMAARPTARLGELAAVVPESARLLPDPSRPLALPARPYPRVLELPFAFAGTDPEAPAVRRGGRQWSYGQLAGAAGSVARAVAGAGLTGRRVAVTGERSFGLVAALLGVMRGGGVAVPLDPALPATRRRKMAETAEVAGVVRAAAGADDAVAAERTIVFDPESGGILDGDAAPPAAPAPPLPDAGQPAYVFFTSGTTGDPKGVLGRHRGLDHFIAWEAGALGFEPGGRCAQLTTLAFDAVLRDLFLPLAGGGVLCLPESRDLAAGRILPWLDAEAVAVVHTVPSVLSSWLRGPADAAVTLGALGHLLLAGEPLDRTLVVRFRERFPACPARIWNLYGPTETTLIKSCYPVPESPRPGVQSLGRPLPETELLVLADRGAGPRLAIFGELGEIGVRTPFRTAGYLDPRATAERFVPNPFRAEAAAEDDLIYLTGDRGRYLADGEVGYAGRADDQVKIRGVRVEPNEVLAQLLQAPAVREAVVLGREVDGETRLVAYVVGGATADELRRQLRQRLPEALVPAHFVELDALPLTASGKVDRGALPDPLAVRRPGGPAPARAPSPVESEVAELVARLLAEGASPEAVASRVAALVGGGGAAEADAGRSDVEAGVVAAFAELLPSGGELGPDSDFFDLGGHSLLAMQLMAKLQRDFGVELPLDALFEAPTPGELARLILKAGAAADAGSAPPEATPGPSAPEPPGGGFASLPAIVPDPGSRFEPFALSDLQEAYWIGQDAGFELGARAHSYRELALPGLDLERFEAAWRRLVERHDMLRAVVLPSGELQVLERAPRPFSIEVADLSALAPGEAEARVAEVRERMVRRGPRTDTWPLFETFAHRMPDGTVRFHVSVSLIASDGWSTILLIGELARLYRDPQAVLPQIGLAPRDYAVAVARSRTSAAYERARTYWWRRLDGLPEHPALPLAREPSAAGAPSFARRTGGLDAERWERLRARAGAAGLTPTATLAAAYAEVLAAWSREPRFLLNLLFFNRLPLHPDVGRLVGNFSTTLLLEVERPPGAAFADAARALEKRLWRDMDHGLVTGVEVLRELNRRRGGGGRAAAPVVFTSTVDLGDADPRERGDLPLVHGALQTPQVWLDHQTWESREGLHWNWDAVAELFPGGLIDAMFDAYGRLLGRLADDDQAWREVPRLLPAAEAERRRVLNATAAPLSGELLSSRFHCHAVDHPERPAILTADAELAYGEVAARARRIARGLARRGAAAGDLVAVVMDKSWQQAVAALGVLESGAAYLPVDAALPPARRARLLERGGVRLALTRHGLLGGLERPAGVEMLAVDRDFDDEPDAALDLPRTPADLAYVIFTSGSTGEPKGVMVDHRAAVNTIEDVERRFRIGPGDRAFGLSSLSFDLSVWDLFGPWSAGGAVVLPGPRQAREPSAWLALCRRHGVTVWNSVPALAEMLTAHLDGRDGAGLPDSLRLVMLSGDWIPVTLPDRLRADGRPGLEVVSLGGATEAAVWSIVHPVGDVDPAWPSIPYGRPMVNQTVHVLDAGLRPRPDRVAGEIYLGGAGLARGYWREAARTAEAFPAAPAELAGEAGDRLYRTGDWGRVLPSGDVELLGRRDLQVKIRGYRVELGEIEAQLARHPALESAVVTAPPSPDGERRLVAYVVAAEPPADPDLLRRHLEGILPDYMVPPVFVELEALPLSANGKVDRRALPAPGAARRRGAGRVAPRDHRERRLVALWREVLGVDEVGVEDDFFALGGHSLTAVRLAARIRAELGQRLPLSALLEGATVAALAKRLAAGERAARSLVAIGQGSGPRLFLVHPVGGNVLCYAELARALGDAAAVFGLESLPLPSAGGPPSVEEMAAAYLGEVRAAQSEGPYWLGGWSMGGTVAFEMARQLRAAGAEVAPVAMIDVAAPRAYADVHMDEAWLLARFARDLGGLVGSRAAAAEAVDAEALRGLETGARSARVGEWARHAGALPAELDEEGLRELVDLFAANFRALADFQPRYLDATVVLMPAAEAVAEFRGAAEAWRPLAAEARTIPVAGDHYSLMRPPRVGELASALCRVLAEPPAAGVPG